jgi:hypothetical protein
MNITAYKFTALQTSEFRIALTTALITRGFKAWLESDALHTDATIEEIDWITGLKNHFLAA